MAKKNKVQVFAPDVDVHMIVIITGVMVDIPTSDTTDDATANAENQAPSQPAGISDQV